MKRAFLSAGLSLALALTVAAPGRALAGPTERDKRFFASVEGNWDGPGEIIAGKYKGTKFNCSFAGSTPARRNGMTLDGGCRVGVFMQKMTATIEHSAAVGYKGKFMDGAAGSGLDIVSGNVVDGRKVVLAIIRNELRGVMQARVTNQDTMTVTVSVKVEESMVPVIGMNLKRVDPQAVGAITGN